MSIFSEGSAVIPGKKTWVTMITPFDMSGKIDYSCVDALVERYIGSGCSGIFAVCQSSEMFFLSEDERVELAEHVVARVGGRIPVVVSGHISTGIDDQIRELRRMAGTGADAVVVVTNCLAAQDECDDVVKRTTERLLEHLPEIPLGLYECPYPYKRLLSPALLRWFADTGRFYFLKDTCCNIVQIKAKLDAIKGSRLEIYNANAPTLLESLRAGCAGYCGIMLNFTPELYLKLLEQYQTPAAERLQSFCTLEALIEYESYPICCKYFMQLEGIPITLKTRSLAEERFTDTMRLEIRHLASAWKEFRERENI